MMKILGTSLFDENWPTSFSFFLFFSTFHDNDHNNEKIKNSQFSKSKQKICFTMIILTDVEYSSVATVLLIDLMLT